MSRNRLRFSKPTIAIGVFGLALGLLAGLTALISGKPALGGSMGLVDDWTHHHVIFSNPGTAVEALAQGRIEQWYRIVNDPRYIMQQAKRNHVSTGLTANPQDFSTLLARLTTPVTDSSLSIFRDPRNAPPRRAPAPHRDWAVSLGSGGVAQNMYPAKFTFDINATPNCASDFVVYGLNVAGSTGGQGNLVALNNLYSGTSSTSCTGHTTATPYWAYNATFTTAGKVTTSPVLSLDGTEVIYVESGGSTGPYLHVLVWNSADGGTATASKAPAHVLAAGTGVSGCTSGASCLVSILLNSTKETVTNSSPFYDYYRDTVYVGDDVGNLYKVTPVLGTSTNPVVTKLNVGASTILTGPVLDTSTNGNIYVGGTNGTLYAVNASTFALQTHPTLQVGNSSCGSGNNVLIDPPIVDPTNGWVYEYVTANSVPETVVEQASTAGPAGSGFTGTAVGVGVGDSGCDSGSVFSTHLPQFDNAYYNGTVTSGHLWVCGRGPSSSAAELWEIATSGTKGALGTAAHPSTNINETDHAECSPFTEIYNGTSDFLFTGEGLAGSFASLYGFTISGTTATAVTNSPITGYPNASVNGGTSGIVIDNISAEAQASSIYFTLVNPSTSSIRPCGAATGLYCAIKLTQSQLQ